MAVSQSPYAVAVYLDSRMSATQSAPGHPDAEPAASPRHHGVPCPESFSSPVQLNGGDGRTLVLYQSRLLTSAFTGTAYTVSVPSLARSRQGWSYELRSIASGRKLSLELVERGRAWQIGQIREVAGRFVFDELLGGR